MDEKNEKKKKKKNFSKTYVNWSQESREGIGYEFQDLYTNPYD